MDVADTIPSPVCVHFGIFLVEDYCATTCLNEYMIPARGKKTDLK